jgi:hypothetical protein
MATPRDEKEAAARPSGAAGKVLGQLQPDERVQIFFTVSGIPAKKKVPNAARGMAYSVLRNLVAPANPMDNRDRSETDRALRPQATYHRGTLQEEPSARRVNHGICCGAKACNFGTYLKDARLVCGLSNEERATFGGRLPCHKADLDLTKAVKRAIAMGAAQSHTQALKGLVGKTDAPEKSTAGGKNRYRCGNRTHDASHCRCLTSLWEAGTH